MPLLVQHGRALLHCAALADAISELYDGERSWQDNAEEVSGRVTPAAIAQLRKDTLQLIMQKSRQGPDSNN